MPTKAVNLRVDEELYEYLTKRAEKEHRTLSNMIHCILSDTRYRPISDENMVDAKVLVKGVKEMIKQSDNEEVVNSLCDVIRLIYGTLIDKIIEE